MAKVITTELQHSGASAANITLDSSKNVTVANNLTVTGTVSGSNYAGRNLIINGSMQVAQYGTTTTANGYQTVDRWNTESGGQDELPTREQVAVTSGGAYDAGFRKALKITNGNQTSGADAGDYMAIYQPLEAQNVAQSGWNYVSSSSKITLSFWIKASVAKTYYFYIATVDGTKQIYPMETGSLTADTWTKVTKTIPGATNNTIDNNNGAGLELMIWPYIGTNYTDSGVSLNTWAAYAGGTRTPDDATSWWTANDATLEITGVQLEVGDVATEFEHKPYGDELVKCMRYFEGVYMGSGTALFKSYTYGSDKVANYDFKVEKRAAPTIALAGNAAWSGATPTQYPSKTTTLMQHSSTDFFLGDANGDLCLTISSEL